MAIDFGNPSVKEVELVAQRNVVPFGADQVIDGNPASPGETVLLIAQDNPHENGLWFVRHGWWNRVTGIRPGILVRPTLGTDGLFVCMDPSSGDWRESKISLAQMAGIIAGLASKPILSPTPPLAPEDPGEPPGATDESDLGALDFIIRNESRRGDV